MRIVRFAHSLNSTVLTKDWAVKVSAFVGNGLEVIALDIWKATYYILRLALIVKYTKRRSCHFL